MDVYVVVHIGVYILPDAYVPIYVLTQTYIWSYIDVHT